MITLYHCETSRSFRALWTLEELQLPYELKVLPFPPRVRAKSFLVENPAGTVPLLIDGEMRLIESAAICHYLPVRYGPSDLAVDPTHPAFGTWLDWLHYSEASLTYPLTIALRYGWLEAEANRVPAVTADHKAKFLGRLGVLAAALEGQDYIAAGRFTSADIAIAFNFILADWMGLAQEYPKAIGEYWARLQDRSSYTRALEAQRQGVSAMKAARAAQKAEGR